MTLLNSVKAKRAIRNDPMGLPEEWLWENYAKAIDRMVKIIDERLVAPATPRRSP